MAEGTAGLPGSSSIVEAFSGPGPLPRFGLSLEESVLLTSPLSWAGRSGARRAWPTRGIRPWLKWWHFVVIFSLDVVVREDGVVAHTGLLFFVKALGVLIVVRHLFVLVA